MSTILLLLPLIVFAMGKSADSNVHDVPCNTPKPIQTTTGIVPSCCKANQKYNELTFSCQDCIEGYSNCVPNTFSTCHVDIRIRPCILSTPPPEVIHKVASGTLNLNTTGNHYIPKSTDESPEEDNNTFDKHEGASDFTAPPEEEKGAERAPLDDTEMSRGTPLEKVIEHVKVQIQIETKESHPDDTKGDYEGGKETPKSKKEEESKCENTITELLTFALGIAIGAAAILIWFALGKQNFLPNWCFPKIPESVQQTQDGSSNDPSTSQPLIHANLSACEGRC